jgi:hypothetical protein
MKVRDWWIAPQPVAMRRRTRTAWQQHRIMQMCCYGTGAGAPTDLAFTFGLHTVQDMGWFDVVTPEHAYWVRAELTRLIARHYRGSFSELDLNHIHLALRCLSQNEANELVNRVDYRFFILGGTSFNSAERAERARGMQVSDKIPPDILQKLEMNLAELEASLLANDGKLAQHMRASHQLLISYPETVHLLDDAEVSRLITGAEQLASTQIVVVKTKAASRKKPGADEL